MLLDSAVDHVVRARLLAARSPGFGDWLEALPLPSAGRKVDNATVRIPASLRLAAPIVCPHVCVCGKTVAVDGHAWPVLSLRFRSTLAPQPNQRRAPPSFHQVRFIGDARATFTVHRQWQRPDGIKQVHWSRGR